MPIVSRPSKKPAPANYVYSGRFDTAGAAAGGAQRFEPWLRNFPCAPVSLDPAAAPAAANGPGPGGPSGGGPTPAPGYPVFGTSSLFSSSPSVPGYVNPPSAGATVGGGGAGIPAGEVGIPAAAGDSSHGPGASALPKFGSEVDNAAGRSAGADCGAPGAGMNGAAKYWPWVAGGLVALGVLAALSDSDKGAFR